MFMYLIQEEKEEDESDDEDNETPSSEPCHYLVSMNQLTQQTSADGANVEELAFSSPQCKQTNDQVSMCIVIKGSTYYVIRVLIL